MISKYKETAADLHSSGFNCAQAVLGAFCDDYGLDKKTALKLSSGMGSGFRSGEICGAAAGAVQVIGLKYGQTQAEDEKSKAECRAKTLEFIKEFKKRNGALACRDLLAQNVSTTGEKEKSGKEAANKKRCPKLIEDAVDILERSGYCKNKRKQEQEENKWEKL